MLSIPPIYKIIYLATLMHMLLFINDAYKEEDAEDEEFKEVFQ